MMKMTKRIIRNKVLEKISSVNSQNNILFLTDGVMLRKN